MFLYILLYMYIFYYSVLIIWSNRVFNYKTKYFYIELQIISNDKCFKISVTKCLPKRPRQTGQTQIRLLLMKQSDQGLPCLLF